MAPSTLALCVAFVALCGALPHSPETLSLAAEAPSAPQPPTAATTKPPQSGAATATPPNAPGKHKAAAVAVKKEEAKLKAIVAAAEQKAAPKKKVVKKKEAPLPKGAASQSVWVCGTPSRTQNSFWLTGLVDCLFSVARVAFCGCVHTILN